MKMVSSSDSFNTLETKKFYIFFPMIILEFINYKVKLGAKSQRRFWVFKEKNGKFLSVSDIKIIKDEENNQFNKIVKQIEHARKKIIKIGCSYYNWL